MDKYDEAIERLIEKPDELLYAWSAPETEIGCLFQFCSPNGDMPGTTEGDYTRSCGCLTQVRRGTSVAFSKTLTDMIREDARLHIHPLEIRQALLATEDLDERRDILAPYAEWQRHMDATIRKAVEA